MNLTIALDLISLVLSIVLATYAYRLWRLLPSHTTVLLILAFLYASIVRAIITVDDLNDSVSLPWVRTAIVAFYPLAAMGLAGLYHAARRNINGRK